MAFWPLRRAADEPTRPNRTTAPAPAAGSPSEAKDWAALPVLQRTLEQPLRPVAPLDRFRSSLVTSGDPSFLAPLAHAIDPSASGLVEGLVHPSPPISYAASAELPVAQRTTSSPTGSSTRTVGGFRRVADWPIVQRVVATFASSPAEADTAEEPTVGSPEPAVMSSELDDGLPPVSPEPVEGQPTVSPEPVDGRSELPTVRPATSSGLLEATSTEVSGAPTPAVTSLPVVPIQRHVDVVAERTPRRGQFTSPALLELPVTAGSVPEVVSPAPDSPSVPVAADSTASWSKPTPAHDDAHGHDAPGHDAPDYDAPGDDRHDHADELPLVVPPTPGATVQRNSDDSAAPNPAAGSAPLSGFASAISHLRERPVGDAATEPAPPTTPGPTPLGIQRQAADGLPVASPPRSPESSTVSRLVDRPIPTSPTSPTPSTAHDPAPPVEDVIDVPTLGTTAVPGILPDVSAREDRSTEADTGTASPARVDTPDRSSPQLPVVARTLAEHDWSPRPSVSPPVSSPSMPLVGSAEPLVVSAPAELDHRLSTGLAHDGGSGHGAVSGSGHSAGSGHSTVSGSTAGTALSTGSGGSAPAVQRVQFLPLGARVESTPIRRLPITPTLSAPGSARTTVPGHAAPLPTVSRSVDPAAPAGPPSPAPSTYEMSFDAGVPVESIDQPSTPAAPARSADDSPGWPIASPATFGATPVGPTVQRVPAAGGPTAAEATPAYAPPVALRSPAAESPSGGVSFATMFGGGGSSGSDDAPGYTTVELQRAPDEAAPPPAATAPAAEPAPAPSPAPGAGGGEAGASASQLDEMARRLYEPLSARLRAELWLDRERAGYLTDARG